ncbi:CRISPR-associated helicase/endonuclease Cas3 [Methanobrevibacter curvatus]|uniref:CRISPR-associated nuclease/helicase Cas3 n=1 Tax=Methanobrevibacter curvatus TaxID=49547 RepID=A0A162FM45_9EURY|nr:CRISPR-associated helicase/endonuclease Cas3 [Methanobrevibacter curvatus]KZX12040.1 CRISPR-associated nuclease/helicase Cas3 [Methanobrevibacter curvatus]
MEYNLINILRAKSLDDENYLLKDHLKETVKRTLDLEKFIIDNKNSFSYDLSDNIFKKITIASIIHDLGKVDYSFQNQVWKKNDRKTEEWKFLNKFFKDINNYSIKFPRHEILSVIWSTFLLNNDSTSQKIRTIVLLHHYNEFFSDKKDIMEIIYKYKTSIIDYLNFLKNNQSQIEKFINDLFYHLSKDNSSETLKSAIDFIKNNIDFENIHKLLEKINDHDDDISDFIKLYDLDNDSIDLDFIVLLGFLRRSDYSASGGIEIESGDLNKTFDGLSDKINKIISPTSSLWQEEIIKNIDIEKSVLLIAPTGSGKTEFSLLWSERNKRKLIYTLPLRVALNDLFVRFSDPKKGYFEKDSVSLLHSTAFIEYIKEEKDNKKLDTEKMLSSAKMLSNPITLSTPDQIFLTSLNYYGSDKVVSTYPFSSVVIDEIQTYNEEMSAIIIQTLKIVHKLKGKILIITATFPPYFEKFFESIFGENYEIIDVAKLSDDIKSKVKNFNLRRHKIALIEDLIINENSDINKKELTKCLKELSEKSVLVVVNNVMKAINLFDTFCDLEKEKEIYLLHSRLTELEKSKRISEIKEKLDDSENIIVVSTQLVEASVDFDFDSMITEISTIDSQIQRWGRVHRNRPEDYNGSTNIFIFTGLNNGNELVLDKSTKFIYDYKVLKETYHTLKKHENDGVLNYNEERSILNEVFESKIEEKTLKNIYEEKIEKILNNLKYFSVEKRSQAQRLFRNIAGQKLIILKLIELDQDLEDKYSDDFKKVLINSIKDKDSYKKMIEKISETGYELNVWDLKKILYEYSINVPIYLEKEVNFWGRGTFDFKEFYVWDDLSNDDAKKIGKYGIDKIISEDFHENTTY